MNGDALIVFVKAPRPGGVKTRLVPVLGDRGAAAFYRALAEAEVRRTRPEGGDYTRLFFFAPADAGAEIASWFPGEIVAPQEEADLGARMAAAFAEAFRRGARRVAIIGTDVPWVTRDIVLGAFRALDRDAVALGPSSDGGYYLLALARPCPGIFEGVPWSTPGVLAATLARAEALGLSVRLLETLNDIDTLEDVRSAWEELRPVVSPTPGLAESLARALGGAPKP